MTDQAPDYGLDAPPDAPPPVTPWLPGRAPLPGMNYGRLTLPGINDKPQPYVSSVKPDDVTLDEEPAPGAAPPAGPGIPQTHSVKSFRVLNAKGEVVADMPDNPTAGGGNDYYKMQVKKIGDSLVSQAVNPADKQAAARATEFGLSLVGLMPLKEIQAAIVHRYDTDERNSISRETQDAKNKRMAMRGAGGPAPGTPTKGDMAQHKLSGDLQDRVDKIVAQVTGEDSYKKLAELEQTTNEMDTLLSQGGAMGERIAVQKALLALTGKASRESEQSALTAAAGKMTEWANKIGLYTSNDPHLDPRYVQEFKGMLAAERAFASKQKQEVGKKAAERIRAETAMYPEADSMEAADTGYGAITGQFKRAYVPPSERGAAQPASPAPTGGPAVSSHLQKFLK